MRKRQYLFNYSKKRNRFKSCSEEMMSEGDEDMDDMMSGDGEDGGEEEVSSEANRVYFYSEVNRGSVLRLNRAIKSTSSMIKSLSYDFEISENPVILHINSEGGNCSDGLLASDLVRKNPIPVVTVVNGSCASAATFISIVGARRYIYENSFMLIHQLSAGMFGTHASLKDEIQNCDLFMNIMKTLYKKYTKMPSKVLEETLKRDVFFSSKDCLKYGLVDEII